jgi:hypothetical protein
VTYALAAIALASIGLAGTLAIWLHQSTGRERNALDVIDSERKLSAQYMHERDVAVAAERVASDRLKTERDLRARVEAARNEAQRKVRDQLIQHMGTATDDEITTLVRDLFASDVLPGSVPSLPVLPKAGKPGSDDLIDPRTEV